MFAHNVIDKIKLHTRDYGIQINHEFRNELDIIVKLLYQAAQYHVGEYSDILNNVITPMLEKYSNDAGIHLRPFENTFLTCYTAVPYPIIWIDFFVSNDESGKKYKKGILLHKQPNILTVYEIVCVDCWTVNPYIGVVTLDKEGMTENVAVRTVNQFYERKLHDSAIESIISTMQSAFYVLMVLNDRNVTMIEKPASRVMTILAGKNKCKPFVYKVLKITNDVVRYENKREGTYVVKGIRPQHEVAGHERKYKSGVKIWIKTHERGNCKNGIIEKEYVFVNGIQKKRSRKIMLENKGGDTR